MVKFKKGDRVKVKHTDYPAFISVGSTTHIVEIIGGDVATLWCEQYPSGLTFFPSEFELLPAAEATGADESQPTPLKIEAGKFYRTRDGRKVGPMETWPLGGWHADRAPAPLNGGLWNSDGTAWYNGSSDSPTLIAEWVDEPVTETTPIKSPSIVARIDNGQPMPSARPLVHDTKEDADKEAKRLSEKHRGKEFGVFTLIAKHQTEAIYNHEWQRLAANGNKIGAIKAIRELTGFGLKAAKDGLEDWLSRNAA